MLSIIFFSRVSPEILSTHLTIKLVLELDIVHQVLFVLVDQLRNHLVLTIVSLLMQT